MLHLILAHRHACGVIQQDVRRLQHGIREHTGQHAFLPTALVLVLRLPLELTQRCHGIEDPRQLRVLRHCTLEEQRAALGIEPRRQQGDGHFVATSPQVGRLVVSGEGVQVHHAEKGRVAPFLQPRPVLDRAEVVADVQFARRLDPTEDSRHSAKLMPTGHEQRQPRSDLTELDLALLREIEAVAQTAATFIRSHDAERAALSRDTMGERDFVSAVDRGSETIIRNLLAPPGRAVTFMGKERAPDTSVAHGITFIVDPLDGTTNYLHGFAAYAVSIGALVDGELAAAVVVDVPRSECYTAVRNGSTFRDGRPMRVGTITDPAFPLIATGVPFHKPEQIARYLEQLPKVPVTTSGIRRAGAAAIDLAHVACGRVDAFWELRLAPWDVAAGIPLVREAGGIVRDFSGAPSFPSFSNYVAGNHAMHQWLLRTIS